MSRRGGGRHHQPWTSGRYLTLAVLMLVMVGTASVVDAAVYITAPGVTCTNDPRLTAPRVGIDYCLDSTTSTMNKWNGAWTDMATGAVSLPVGLIPFGAGLGLPLTTDSQLAFVTTPAKYLKTPVADTGGAVFNARASGVRCDGVTDDTVALNAFFTMLRARGAGATAVMPDGVCRISGLIDAGGFGNFHLKWVGSGRNQGTNIMAMPSFPAGALMVDFSGNEGGQIQDITIGTEASAAPGYGLLLAGATVNAAVRGGANYLQGVHVAGTFSVAAIYNYNADLCRFNAVLLGTAGTSGAVGLAVVSGSSPIIPKPTASRTLRADTGVTAFYTMNGIYANAGGTPTRAVIHIDGITGVYQSVSDTWTYGGHVSDAIEFIRSGNQLNVYGARHEAAAGSHFIKTDGFKNSVVRGDVQSDGVTPLIDAKGSYGTGAGTIIDSVIALGPSGAGGYLMNTSAVDSGITGSTIYLLDQQSLVISAGQSNGNFIYSDGVGTITLSDAGNIIQRTSGTSLTGSLNISRVVTPPVLASSVSLYQASSAASHLFGLGPNNGTNGIVNIATAGADGSTGAAVVAGFQLGVQVGVPTGGDKGIGTLNVKNAIYANNVLGLTTTVDVLCDPADATKKRTFTFTMGLLTDKGTCA